MVSLVLSIESVDQGQGGMTMSEYSMNYILKIG